MGTFASPTDAQLLAGLQRRDGDALSVLYRRNRASIFRFAMSMTAANPDAAEEIVQETFLALIHRPNGYDPSRGELRTYLLGIAHKKILQYHREDLRTAQLDDRLPEADPAWTVPQEDPLQSVERDQRASLVRDAVEKLPRVYREVIHLCQWEEMSYEQASDALGIAVGTVRSRLHRARALLLKKLATRPIAAERVLVQKEGD